MIAPDRHGPRRRNSPCGAMAFGVVLWWLATFAMTDSVRRPPGVVFLFPDRRVRLRHMMPLERSWCPSWAVYDDRERTFSCRVCGLERHARDVRDQCDECRAVMVFDRPATGFVCTRKAKHRKPLELLR